MNNTSHLDAPFMRVLTKVADLVMVNLLFLLCSLPIITAGASLTALIDCIRRIQNDEGYLGKNFFSAFRSNFKQATVFWLLTLITGFMIIFTVMFYFYAQIPGSTALLVISFLVFLVWIMTVSWVFPLQAFFSNTIKGTLRNAFFCGISYLPRSILMALLNLLPLILFLFATAMFFQGGIIWILCWFSISIYLQLKLLKKPIETLTETAQ